ncbi:glutathione synthase [Suillus fuscotomentosus]|uniref:Glutathione synthetase n=1 Tax=Suillus fuscotomentosus TaxID=1912939 RepID=A0AAD4E573_9AGAM|nr:glutathione synthase [Suillus fuscotomentosus]KAG1899476.1 glutathione synthase [Suillus fuscotomentosus]
MTSFNFSTWPPQLTPEQLEALTLAATTYALSHGLLYLPPSQSPSNTQPRIPTNAIHAPLSLIPAPFPRAQFQAARELQSVYNVLYARVAMDTQFLDTVMGAEEGVGKADEFTGTLWRGWKRIREHGALAQPLHLGLFRSDYLLHAAEDRLALKQVEFNTISSSFGPLSERVAAMHRNILASTSYFSASPHLTADNFPENSTTSGLVEGLSKAHEAYGVRDAHILFVVQPNERNVFDQQWLEYGLLERHQIHVVRQTLAELAVFASIDPSTHALILTSPTNSSPYEISTIYFRATYTPSDFPSPSYYDTRFLLERSRAIKCPSLPLQLAGGKKVQEALTRPGILERFLSNEGAKWGARALDLTAHAADIRATWMGMWALDSEDVDIAAALDHLPDSGQAQGSVSPGTRLARLKAQSLVLKPQREGGGNNVYREAIPAFLETLPAEEREAWIAMEMIETPRGVNGYLVRASPSSSGTDNGTIEKKVVRVEVISELGIFGYALFREGEVEEREVGWLVRTKGTESNEGGVAAGFSVLDSVVLV